MTIASATAELKAKRQHIVVHSHATSLDPETDAFLGTNSYEENIHEGDELRLSDHHRLSVTSPFGTKTVGYIFDGNMRQWFIVDEKHQVTLVDKFYHSGEGLGQHTTTRSLSLPRSGRQPLALHRLAISLTRPKPDAVGQKLTTATRYIWKFPRPKDDKHTRLVLFAAYQATIRVSKDATKIFVRYGLYDHLQSWHRFAFANIRGPS
ncbi:hypothetical protein OCS_00318 [Ophiocordyceps sinensis CO18]|uniref:Uncharacterized protein n=1 Tax=Ophiocordyceps sinensis (strain Co18 / CGMCC 3.14243) TaxID=911162 RepID=T5AMZ1_OPHSC|nr:hypothetical protein OCS_00318 [Ophiocordyceps sinensis CO18]